MNKNNIQSATKIGFLYAASIVGAGFASGKEIFMFFTRFGRLGVVGIIVSTIIFAVLGIIVLKSTVAHKSVDLKQFLRIYFGRAGVIFEYIIISFVFVVFSVMLAGSGEILEELTGIVGYISSLGVLLLSLLIIKRGIVFLQKFSLLLMSILFLGIIIFSVFLSIFNLREDAISVWSMINSETLNNKIWAMFSVVLGEAILYCGYNSILSINSLIQIGRSIKTSNEIVVGSILGGLIFLIPALLMNYSMLPFCGVLNDKDFPFIFIINLIHENLSNIYSFLVLLAMIMAVVINGYYLLEVSKIMPIAAYCMIFSGFSGIISFFYPIYGIIGLIFIIILIIRYFMIK